jgi:hypothetical protein
VAPLDSVVTAYQRRQVLLAQRASTEIGRLWAAVDIGHVKASWSQLLPRAVAVLSSAQGVAAAGAGVYTDDALEAQGIVARAEGMVSPSAFAGVASDGRTLEGLLSQPSLRTLARIGAGVAPARASAAGLLELDMMVRTQVADAGRVAAGVAITARPEVAGFVRMLSQPSCSRCIILAGRHYKWNAGFRRHPRCDCRAHS